MLDQMLIGLNATSPGRIRSVAFLQSKYSTIQKLNQAWYGVPYAAAERFACLFSADVYHLRMANPQCYRNTTYASYAAISTIPPASAAHSNDSNEFAYIAAVKFFNVSRTGMCWSSHLALRP
jgi:hypothetical protein